MYFAFNNILGCLFDPQAESNVVEYIQMREKSILLEYGIDLPFIGWDLCNICSVHINMPGRRHDKTGNKPQGRGLTAAGRPQQGKELSVIDIQIHMFQSEVALIVLGNVHQFNQSLSHFSFLMLRF